MAGRCAGCLICTALTTSLWAELSCNFEVDLCGWYQDRGSDFQWIRSTGKGQGSDHTTGSGKGLAPLVTSWAAGVALLLQSPGFDVPCVLWQPWERGE